MSNAIIFFIFSITLFVYNAHFFAHSQYVSIDLNTNIGRGRRPSGIVDCNIVVSELELQSNYYVHFWTNNLGKVMNSSIPAPAYALNRTTT